MSVAVKIRDHRLQPRGGQLQPTETGGQTLAETTDFSRVEFQFQPQTQAKKAETEAPRR